MTPKSPDARWADSRTGRLLAERIRRPKALLLAEVYLVVAALALARLILAGLLIPGFLASPDNVPPFIADAAVTGPMPVAVFGLPITIALLALAGTRRPGRVPWSWTQLGVAWLVVAFAEWPFASADFTAAVLALGAVPAALIGGSLTYLRRVAGQEWKVTWTRRRTLLISIVVVLVAAFYAAWLYAGVVGMDFRFPYLNVYAGPFAH